MIFNNISYYYFYNSFKKKDKKAKANLNNVSYNM